MESVSPQNELIAALNDLVRLREIEVNENEALVEARRGKNVNMVMAALEFARARPESARGNWQAMIQSLRLRIDLLEEEYAQLQLRYENAQIGRDRLNEFRELVLEAKIDLYTARLGREPDWR